VATAESSGLVVVRETATSDEIAHLQHSGVVEGIVFSNDARYMAVRTEVEDSRFTKDLNENHVLHVWALQLRDLVEEANRRLERFSSGKSAAEKH
jgi:hypothetical protein